MVNWDLHDGLDRLVAVYVKDADHSLALARVLHITLLIAAVACMAAFFVLLLRPFIARVRKEGRRVAELLVQLPADLDLDVLVAALTDLSRAAAQPRAPPAGASGAWDALPPGMHRGGWSGGGPGGGGPMSGGVGGSRPPWLGGGGDVGAHMFTPRYNQQAGGDWGADGGATGVAGGDGMRRRRGAGRRVAPEPYE